VIEAGTVKAAWLLVSDTTAPPRGAIPLSVTVHAALLELLREPGRQKREVTVGRTFAPTATVPPIPKRGIAFPRAEAATPLLIPIEVVVAPAAMITFTTARVPFEMVAALMPHAQQVYTPEPGTQLIVLPALVAAAPAVTDREATLPAG
jgi:hypothetical protein